MITSHSINVRTNFQPNFDPKYVQTPHTAQSISENVILQQSNDISFSSIISSADKFFIYSSDQNENEGGTQMLPKQESQNNMISCQQIINKSQKLQSEFDFSIILSNSQNESQIFHPIKLIKTSLFNMKQIDDDKILTQDEINIFNENKIKQIVISEFQNKYYSSSNKDLNYTLTLKLIQSGFNRQIFNFFNQEIKQNSFFNPNSNIALIKNINNQKLILIFSYTQVIKLKQLQNQLKNKSPLLNNIANIKQLQGIIFQLCQQNMGSRIIQKIIHLSPKQSIQHLNVEIQSQYHLLMKQKYGNYIIQKIFSHLKEHEKSKFLQNISQHISQIVKTKFGTFCMQFILKKCNKIESCMLVLQNSVQNFISQLSMNQYGTFFLQQLVQVEKFQTIQKFLLQEKNFIQNSKDKFGILTLKSLMFKLCKLNNYNISKKTQLVNLIYKNFKQIMTNEYGHFLVQQLPKYYQPDELNWVFWSISQKLYLFTEDKYSFSPIRVYLQIFSYTWTNPLIYNIFNSEELLISLMQCKQGSYLINRLLDLTDVFTNNWALQILKKKLPQIKIDERRYKWRKFLKI